MLPTGPTNRSLYPKSPKSLKSQWVLRVPQLSDPIETIEVDETFLISLGCHTPHENYMLCSSRKPTLEELSQIESLISFYFDCPSAFIDPRFKQEARTINNGLYHHYQKFHGIKNKDFFRPFEGIEELVEMASLHGLDSYRRHLDNLHNAEIAWKLKLPKDQKRIDALFVYRQASMSVDPYSRILNYWRCLEALTNKQERENLFKLLPNISLAPVIAYKIDGRERFNLMDRYIHEMKLHHNRLMKALGTSEEISKHFYKKRRCPIAHANDDPLRVDGETSHADLVRDAILLKVLARHVIEESMIKG